MSKKRKTRSQKEKSVVRREHTHTEHTHTIEEAVIPVSYSVTDIKAPVQKKEVEIEQKKDSPQLNYLKHDIRTITLASGIVLAFDILLFTLLSTGTLNLGFLGY